MKDADNIKELFEKSSLNLNPARDLEIQQKVLDSYDRHKPAEPVQIWKIIMRNKLTKLAAAAVIILLFSLFTVNILIKRSHTKTNSSAQYIPGDNQHKVMEFDTSPRYILFNAQNNHLKETNPCNILPVLPKQL
jgi:hypothetical protein